MTEASPELLRAMREVGRVRGQRRVRQAARGDNARLPHPETAVRDVLAAIGMRATDEEARECALAFQIGLRSALKRAASTFEEVAPIQN